MAITFNDISFKYDKIGYVTKEILKNINVKINTGEITSIIGKVGSGKTTFLKLINKSILPTKGEITYVKKTVMSNQEEMFLTNSVEEELISAIILDNYKTEDFEKRIHDSLILVGLKESFKSRLIASLSCSELKKISLAKALITNPKVLLLDDPTYGLDQNDIKNLIKLIKLLKKRYNKTIIIASNNIDFIHSITDNIIVINNKNIIMNDTKYNVFKNYKNLNKHKISEPYITEFSNKVLDKKNIKIGYRDEINDLIKDIYRYVK